MGTYDELTQLNDKASTPQVNGQPGGSEKKSASKVTRKPTRALEISRGLSRDKARKPSRGKSHDLPTRDAIQEFSFRLRDELKVKVQAEVPHTWQKEFAEMARKLDVKKLELYRFILGEYLGKVKREKPARS